MLSSIRKFSNSIYAKILLGIIIIPFVFWGMGSSFTGGNKNVVVVIDDEKYSAQEFGNFINETSNPNQKITSEQIENLLSIFIGEKLLEQEAKYHGINLSDLSLSKVIKNQKNFMRENKFSRTEYEKFLLVNNTTASNYESKLFKQEKRIQLVNLIGGGIVPSDFIINLSYDQVNQKRRIELIDLNSVFKSKMNFSENQIASFFENSKKKYSEIYKTAVLLDLDPKKLSGSDEFNDLYFEKIDNIDEMIVQGNNFNEIIQKYNLEKDDIFTFDTSGNEKTNKNIKNIPSGVINIILNLTEEEPTILVEKGNKFFLLELIKIEEVQKNLENENVKKDIITKLKNEKKRKLIGEIITKINSNSYSKLDFDQLAKKESVEIQNINLENINDDKILRKELVNQIYRYSEKKVAIVHDLNFTESFLVYVNKIDHVSIDKNSEDYSKYLDLAKAKIKNELYNTYDSLIKKKYKIDINYQTLETVKNYFN